ncbi:MAG: metallopeptidase family protein [Candidatus Eisenbacteria bacterium]
MDSRSDSPGPAELAPRDAQTLARAWDAFEEGDLEEAAGVAEQLMRRTHGHPEVRLLRAALLLEEDDATAALADLDACAGRIEDTVLHAYYRSVALFDLARFEEAEAQLRELAATDLDPGTLHYLRAQVQEHLGRHAEAERDYAAAHAIDAEDFPLPLRIPRPAFEEAVHSARELLPENLRARLDEVPIVVEDLPPRAILDHAEGDRLTPDLLGLFVGRNLREESVFEVPGVPAAIYIFQRNLERTCSSREELVAEIGTTLYHELGHYLGLEEDDLRELDVD